VLLQFECEDVEGDGKGIKRRRPLGFREGTKVNGVDERRACGRSGIKGEGAITEDLTITEHAKMKGAPQKISTIRLWNAFCNA
jgi:hypothetical protein